MRFAQAWAKLDDAVDPPRWHSLVGHSIDVACVFDALQSIPAYSARLSERGTSYEGQRPPPSGHRAGEGRVALVIGNSAYAHAEALTNPVNDAEAMAGVLARLGFDVVKGIDVDLRGIGDLQAVFEDKLRSQPDVALLFYADHGLQVTGRNYLVPTDAEITQRAHLASRALLFNDLLDDMASQANARLIFLDEVLARAQLGQGGRRASQSCLRRRRGNWGWSGDLLAPDKPPC